MLYWPIIRNVSAHMMLHSSFTMLKLNFASARGFFPDDDVDVAMVHNDNIKREEENVLGRRYLDVDEGGGGDRPMIQVASVNDLPFLMVKSFTCNADRSTIQVKKIGLDEIHFFASIFYEFHLHTKN